MSFGEKVSQMLATGVQAGYLNSEQDYDSEVSYAVAAAFPLSVCSK